MANVKKTSKRATPPSATLQLRRLDSTVAALATLRAALLAGDCPAATPAGERAAAVIDLERALGQLGNLRRHYGGQVEKR